MVINIIVLDYHRNFHLWNDEGSDVHAKLYLEVDLNVSCSLVSINFWIWMRLEVAFVLWRKTENFLSIEDMEIDYKLVLHARQKLCFDIWKINEVQWTDSCLNRMTRWSLTTGVTSLEMLLVRYSCKCMHRTAPHHSSNVALWFRSIIAHKERYWLSWKVPEAVSKADSRSSWQSIKHYLSSTFEGFALGSIIV